ncbi:hypothetical protein H1R20_g10479, partial [Candolleomyces eurysporus]
MSSSEKTPLLDQGWHDTVKCLSNDFQNISDGNGDLDLGKKLDELNEVVKAGAASGKIDVTEVLVGSIHGVQGQELFNSIEDLAKTINSVDESFAHAHQLLVKVDANKDQQADGSLDQYALKWQELHKVFGRLITESKTVASEGKAYTEVYMRKVPPLLEQLHRVLAAPETQDETFEQIKHRAWKQLQVLKTAVDVLQNDMTALKSKSTVLSGNFTDLSQEIGFLHADLSVNVKAISDQEADEDITKVEKEVKALRAELASLNQQDNELGNCFTSFYASGGTAAGGALLGCGAAVLACPAFIPGILLGVTGLASGAILGSGVATGVVEGKIAATQSNLSKAQKNLEELKHKHDVMVQSKSDIARIGQDITNIEDRLMAITGICNAIESDATEINSWLENCFKDNDISVEIIVRGLEQNNISKVYGVLAEVLQEYAIQVSSSGAGYEGAI